MDASGSRRSRARGGDVAGTVYRIRTYTPPRRVRSLSVSESRGLSALLPSDSPVLSWSRTRADPAPCAGNICLEMSRKVAGT